MFFFQIIIFAIVASACHGQEHYKYKPVHRQQLKEHRYPSVHKIFSLENQEPAPIHEEEVQAAPEVQLHGRHESAVSSQSIVHYQPAVHEESQSQESLAGQNEPSVAYKHYYQGHEQVKLQQGDHAKNNIQVLHYPAVSHEAPQVPSHDEAHYIRVPAHNYHYVQGSEQHAPAHHEVEQHHQVESHSHDEPIDYYVSMIILISNVYEFLKRILQRLSLCFYVNNLCWNT